ncbi:phytochrome [Pedobacter sp. HMWF019]|uniref:GAF domain-containing protein n=1 Tax=Pedobacter sp. HMWF019 TaxID=2056856 RepID=UPI000D3319B2|nr:GAF domain-containing protein [Pedobacter sp. HMWF019]PTT01800.1 phytochrome [Pedobacter sp. HMWF019]
MTKKTNYDSDFCGSLPLNHINSIQSYGYLVVLESVDLQVIQVSENIDEITGTVVQDFVNTPISRYLEEESVSGLKRVLNSGVRNRIPLNISFKPAFTGLVAHALVHIKPEYLILEFEPIDPNAERGFTDVFQDIKYIMSAIDEAESVQEVAEIAIHEMRRISAFDGVLMYRFDKDWNGTVIAEEKNDHLEPYIGQTFPASDIPKQARQLYLKNPYRLIPNREFKPVRLYPVINPVTHAFIDLSDCNLRSVAGVHLEYMKNMNIKSSMSVRVIYNENLWGLISCHHIEEKHLNFQLCSIFEWLSTVISSRISLLIDREKFEMGRTFQEKRTVLTDLIYSKDDISGLLMEDGPDKLLDLFSASGVVVSLDHKLESSGVVPGKNDLDNLLLWLEGKNVDKVFSTNHIIDLYEDAADFAEVGSGLLVIPIHIERGEFLIFFRPEVIEDIHWGGNPNEAINFEKDGKNYHPRHSFKMWKQTVRKHSLAWGDQELEVAESLRSFLFEFRTKQLYN